MVGIDTNHFLLSQTQAEAHFFLFFHGIPPKSSIFIQQNDIENRDTSDEVIDDEKGFFINAPEKVSSKHPEIYLAKNYLELEKCFLANSIFQHE